MIQQQTFTAAQIAAALRVSVRSVRRSQDGHAATGIKVVNGQQAAAWAFCALAPGLQQRLQAEGLRLGLESGEQLLNRPPKIWQPPMALSRIAQESIDRAVKLQRVLAPMMPRQEQMAAGEFEALGVRDYAAVFGHKISTRHFRELVKRTVERDGGVETWDRLEIYLDANPVRKQETLLSNTTAAEFQELHTLISIFRNPAAPSRDEQSNLWARAVELLADSKALKKSKRRLLEFLWRHAPSLGKSPNALRVNLDRKLKAWQENEAVSFKDGRCAKRGQPTAAPIDADDVDYLIFAAVARHGGRVSQAVREERDKLKPETQALIDSQGTKSRVNGRLRNALRYEVEQLLPYQQGPRAVDKVSASQTLDYTGIYADRCWMADDFTMPVIWYVPDGNWFKMVRGQVIIFIDFRTLRILGFSLQPDEQYNSLGIRTLATRLFAEHGMPEILYFERGLWKLSKLITGGPKAEAAVRDGGSLSWAECETGLRQYGIRFIHARRARSKPVERVGGLLQDRMEGLPGYCGREERKDKPEIVTAHEREVMSRRVHPSVHFMDQEQWENQLAAIIEKYNHTPQEGRRLNGLSPEEAYEQLRNPENPPTRFDASCRWLLAHHKIPVMVSDNGIQFRIRGVNYRYVGAETSPWRGHKLLAWFNPELPEVLTVTDQNQKNAFTVDRYVTKPGSALSPDPDGTAKCAAHSQHQRIRYRLLKTKYKPQFRVNLVSPQTVALGQQIEQQQAERLGQRDDERSLQRTANRLVEELGLPSSLARNPTQEKVEAWQRMKAHQKEESI